MIGLGADPYLTLTTGRGPHGAMVELQTLGRLELRAADGERLHAIQARPKDLGLLTYLATAGPFALERRDTLLALFWPDLDAARARNALSQALHRLRERPAGRRRRHRGT